MNIIKGPIRRLNRKIKAMHRKIEDNKIKISEIEELRRGMGKPKKEDIKNKKLINKKRKYER